jgi:hypothetical protein
MNKSQVTKDLFILFINFIVIDKQRPFKSNQKLRHEICSSLFDIRNYPTEFDANTFELNTKTHFISFVLPF